MEAAGLALGVISLAFDVFDNTIRIFKFLSALVDMPQNCQKYRVQLIMEYNRVLAWGKAAGLVDVPEGSTLADTLGTNATELVTIIARIQWLLSEFRDLNARYDNEVNPSVEKAGGKAVGAKVFDGKAAKADADDERAPLIAKATDVDVVKQVSSLAVSYEAKKTSTHRRWGRVQNFIERAAHNTKVVVTHPVRVRWVKIDEEAFKGLLEDLHVLTERLHELMRNHRQKEIDDITAKTYREMILARNDVQDLRHMLDAVRGLIASSSNTHQNDRTLQDLVRLKEISRTSDMILSQLTKNGGAIQTITDEAGTSVPRFTADRLAAEFEWLDSPKGEGRRTRGVLYDGDLVVDGKEVSVWIEWKPFGDIPAGGLKDKETALRTIALAEMLHIQKPASLYTPECVGYFDDRDVSGADRYGWMFRMPQAGEMVSLHHLLGHDKLKPSLSQRVALALKLCTTVLNLHAVNWLHKGMFSDNVLFYSPQIDGTTGPFDMENPILSGFEFSRPVGSQTTAREANPLWDLYRWPGIQREPPMERNSRKTYDIYGLGLILLEIAHWKPLRQLLLLGDGPDVTLKESKLVRDWLLGKQGEERFRAASKPNPLEELRNVAGDRYWRAVTRCLWAHGNEGLGVGENEEQSNPSVGTLLQEAFTVHVVDELSAISL